MNFSDDRTGTGTKEWSDKSINIGQGCSHNCEYCYARGMALRFKRIDSRNEWATEIVDPKKVMRRYTSGKVGKVLMFPTTHDITPAYLPHAITALSKMLGGGNQVLIVSKPHLDCIREMCTELGKHKDRILFRFTIGTLNAEVSKFWEPGAPLPAERLQALAYASEEGFSTSLSMEPMLLGTDDAIKTFNAVEKYVSETVWIGKMNKARQRVDISRPEFLEAVREIERLQSDADIMRLVDVLKDNPKVKWKDSIKKLLSAKPRS